MKDRERGGKAFNLPAACLSTSLTFIFLLSRPFTFFPFPSYSFPSFSLLFFLSTLSIILKPLCSSVSIPFYPVYPFHQSSSVRCHISSTISTLSTLSIPLKPLCSSVSIPFYPFYPLYPFRQPPSIRCHIPFTISTLSTLSIPF